jgi:hypothetical protein
MFTALPSRSSYAAIPAANEAAAWRLARDRPASPPATRWLRHRRAFGCGFRCHGTAEFERLVEIIGIARGLFPAVAKVDAILAGQAPKGDTEETQFALDKLEARAGISEGHGTGSNPESD